MQPTSASIAEDTATGSRRKWGGFYGGESIVAFAPRTQPLTPGFGTPVAPKPQLPPIVRPPFEILLTVRACASFCWPCAGAQRMFAMFEMLTTMMGLVGAGIFIAHAFEGVLSRT
jgi:hypothetical protein